MQPEVKKSLFDILSAADEIQEFTRGLDWNRYQADSMVQAAVERKFEVIGEAMNRIKRVDSSLAEAIPGYERIIGFRNIISHGYDVIDPEIVWNAIRTICPHSGHA